MQKMKKGKIIMTITIGIACFVLVAIMFMQFKIVNETDITSIEVMQEAELRTELSNWKEKYEEANQKYEETKATIEEYKKTKESNEETSKLLEQELEQVNMALGKTDVEGQGIVITIKEGDTDEFNKISSDDLLIIANALKLAGAEAVSINDERIIRYDMASINNNTFIKVNGQRILPPYVIKAIGNPTYLESELVGSGGYVDVLRKLGHDITIEPSDKVLINKIKEDITTKYIE